MAFRADALVPLEAKVDAVAATLARLELQRAEDRRHFDGRIVRVYEILQRIFDHEQLDRERLQQLRGSSDYVAAYEEPEPLVSVVIPTWNNVDGLLGRSLPAVLAQTYPNIEVIIVGDAAPAETEEALRALGDPRVRFANLTVRGPYPDDPREAWLVSGSQPYNEAVRLAKGLWIAPMADDDEMHPEQVASLLAEARSSRSEMTYSQLRQIRMDGTDIVLGGFPPRFANIGLQSSIYHAGLRFMELELAHGLFGTPNDWGLIRRMWIAGVRISFLDRVLATYWPSSRAEAASQPPDPPSPATDAETELRQELELLRSDNLLVRGSRRWRYTSGLRRMLKRPRTDAPPSA